jgi:hypothetical protein
MGTGVPFPGVRRGRGVTLTNHHLVPRSRISRSYTSASPWRLHSCSGTALLLYKRGYNLSVRTKIKLRSKMSVHAINTRFNWIPCSKFGDEIRARTETTSRLYVHVMQFVQITHEMCLTETDSEHVNSTYNVSLLAERSRLESVKFRACASLPDTNTAVAGVTTQDVYIILKLSRTDDTSSISHVFRQRNLANFVTSVSHTSVPRTSCAHLLSISRSYYPHIYIKLKLLTFY